MAAKNRNKQRRRASAAIRKANWEMLSVPQKLEALKKRGHGECEQAQRLERLVIDGN